MIHALHGEQDIRNMGGLKNKLPITFWTFMIASLAIAGVPGLAGFFSKDEILFETFSRGYQWLWVVGVITSLLTATYMFRLVYLTFYGESRFTAASLAHAGHGHDDARGATDTPTARTRTAHAGIRRDRRAHGAVHLHDAPPAMAIALVLLAIGSVARRLHRHPACAWRTQPAGRLARAGVRGARARTRSGGRQPARR